MKTLQYLKSFGAGIALLLSSLNSYGAQLYIENHTSCNYTVDITWKKTLCPSSCGATATSLTLHANNSLSYDAPGSNQICSVTIRSGLTVLSTWSCQTGTWTPSNPTGCGGYILWFHGPLNNCDIDYT